MSAHINHHGDTLFVRVRTSLGQAKRFASRHRKWDVVLLTTNIIFGAVATVLAASTTVTATTRQALGGWHELCTVVAVLTLVGTTAGLLHKTFRVSDRLGKALGCVGRLQALEVALSVTGIEPRQATETYQHILRDYPECF